MRKSLTRSRYRLLLETIGKSKEPLSSYQIAKRMGNLQDKYVYAMLKELFPQEEYPSFRWNEIPDDDYEKSKFVDIVTDIFGLTWIKEERKIYRADKNNEDNYIDFEKSHDNKALTVSRGKHKKVKFTLEFDPNDVFQTGTLRMFVGDEQQEHRHVTVRIIDGDEIHLLIIATRKSTFAINPNSISKFAAKYLDKELKPITYLKHELEENSFNEVSDKMVQKSMMNIPEGAKLSLEIAKIERNRSNWRYGLNIRGFILYLLGEIESEKYRKGSPEKKARVHNIRISKVLENLSEHYLKGFPFLLHYSDFKNEYARLADLGEVQKNFEIKLLKEIAEELQYQVHTARNDFLRYWVTRRFSGGITYYFTTKFYVEYVDVDETLKYLSFAKLKEYMLTNLCVISEYLGDEYRQMNGEYDLLEVTNFKLPVYY